MNIIEAKSVVEQVPVDLRALRIAQRASQGPVVRICAVGDIGLSGRAMTAIRNREAEGLFTEVAPVLQAADVTFGNLESSLAGDIAPGKLFAAPVTGAAALRKAGFNLIHLANNHIGDFGQAGLSATLQAVREAGMTPLGSAEDRDAEKQLIRTDAKELRIGWLGCGHTLVRQKNGGPRYWEFDENELLTAVQSARPTVDVLIVSIHLGLMFLDYPHPDHKVMAERLMQAGANLILMHHAHVLQGIQVSDCGQICCYNLGNFLYDCLEGDILTKVMLKEQEESALFVFDIDEHGVVSLTVLPIWTDSDYHVRWAVQQRGDMILERLQRISLALTTNYQREFDRQRVERNFGHNLRDILFYGRHGDWKYVLNRLRRVRFEHLRQLMMYPFMK